MESVSFWTYPLVFLSVFVPYLAVAALVATPRVAPEPYVRTMPFLYRVAYRYIVALAQGAGQTLENAFPALSRQMGNTILRSGLHLTPAMVYAAQLFASGSAAIVFGIGLFLLSGEAGWAVCSGALGCFLGWVYPSMIVQKIAQERQVSIIRSLPFAIDLLASAMRAGLDFMAAVRYYVSMGDGGALAVEFGLLLRQMELGKSRAEALEEMATHVQTEEFSAFVGAVEHGTEIGASIIDTLQVQGEDMRRARFNLAERKAARAPSIMIFPIALFILPAVFAIVLIPVFLRFKAAKGGA